MSRRRWIADECSADRATLTGRNARHLSQVLRAKIGQMFEIACNGEVRLGSISKISDQCVEFDLGEMVEAISGPSDVTLLMAVFKFDRFEWAIEKVTELGVARIIPVIAQRTDVHLAKAAEKRVERWRRIVHEASQQSRRIAEPQIDAPLLLKKAATEEADVVRIFLSENEKNISMRDFAGNRPLRLAVGPEGGWTSSEEDTFRKAGWQAASLGPTILRAETAAIAALAIVSSVP